VQNGRQNGNGTVLTSPLTNFLKHFKASDQAPNIGLSLHIGHHTTEAQHGSTLAAIDNLTKQLAKTQLHHTLAALLPECCRCSIHFSCLGLSQIHPRT
jgi:hypothetical protein